VGIVVGDYDWLVEEYFLRFTSRDAMSDPIFLGVTIIPLEARAAAEPFEQLHPSMYITHIYRGSSLANYCGGAKHGVMIKVGATT